MKPEVQSSAISAGGDFASTLFSGFMSAHGQSEANKKSAREADIDRQWRDHLFRNQHLIEVRDLKKAGLNPILSAKYGGQSIPSGAMPSIQNENSAFATLSLAQQLKDLKVKDAMIKKIEGEAESAQKKGFFDKIIRRVGEKMLNFIQTDHSAFDVKGKGFGPEFEKELDDYFLKKDKLKKKRRKSVEVDLID